MDANGAHRLHRQNLVMVIYFYMDMYFVTRGFLPKDILSCKLKLVTGKRWVLCVKSHHNDNQLHLKPSARPFLLDRL